MSFVFNRFTKGALRSCVSLTSKSIPSFYRSNPAIHTKLYRGFTSKNSKQLSKPNRADLKRIDDVYSVSEVVIEKNAGVVQSVDDIQDDQDVVIKPRDEKVIIQKKITEYRTRSEDRMEKQRQTVFNLAVVMGVFVFATTLLLNASPKILERKETKQFHRSPIMKDVHHILRNPVFTDGPACFDDLWISFFEEFDFNATKPGGYDYLKEGAFMEGESTHVPMYNGNMVHPMHFICGEDSDLFKNVLEASSLDDDGYRFITHMGAET